MINISIEPTQLSIDQVSSLSIRLTNLGTKPCTHVNFRLRFPSQIVLLEGNDKVEILKIEPSQNVIQMLQVRPKQVGSWIIESSSFSYRDGQGQSQHPAPFQQEVKVVPNTSTPPSLEAKVFVKLSTKILPLNEWDQLEGEVVNSGNVTLRNVECKVSGPVTLDSRISSCNLGMLRPGESERFHFLARAEESGNKVPIHIEVLYDNEIGQSMLHDELIPVQVTITDNTRTSQLSTDLSLEKKLAYEKTSLSVPKIFISYSHVDEKHMARLISMLRPLEKQGILKIWHDRKIMAGNDWYQDIRNAINTCDLALLLVSIDFLNSRFIQEDELPRLLQLRKERGLRVIPIIVRHCTWTSVPLLKDLQALPKNGRPVVSFKGAGQPDRIWTEIVRRIEELAKTP